MENSPEINSLLILAIGTAAMLLLSFSIVGIVLIYQRRVLKQKFELQEMEVAYQKRLLDAAIESQENERKRIASELHDDVGAMLSTVKLNLGFVKSTLKEKEALEALVDTHALLDQTIEGVRRISKDLMPTTLAMFGIDAALQELADRVNKTEQIRVQFETIEGQADWTQREELLLFRIVQEALNNTLKHAQATQIDIRLDHSGIEPALQVEDNGKGFDFEHLYGTNQQSKGVGLYSIENRAMSLGRSAHWGPGKNGQGTLLTLVPLEE
jgi:two-component system, NarL family, sensor kinase